MDADILLIAELSSLSYNLIVKKATPNTEDRMYASAAVRDGLQTGIARKCLLANSIYSSMLKAIGH